jgi:heparanase
MSQLLGGLWWEGSSQIVRGLGTEAAPPVDFTDTRLVELTRPFAGGVLRLGGTASDRVRYDLEPGTRNGGRRNGGRRGTRDNLVLSGDTWKAVSTFCSKTGLSLMMTLNCGKDRWDSRGHWDPTNALELLQFDADLPSPASVWALGNEINGYPFVHGLGHFIGAGRYSRAFRLFSDLVRRTHPDAQTAGPASSFWPMVGEPNRKINRFLRSAGDDCDVLTWHYYPVHSRRGSYSTRWASPGSLLRPKTLDELGRYSRGIEAREVRQGFAGERWLGELGPALYGGEPGLSDRYLSGLWWLDALSSAAVAGEDRVARQTLFGSEYGLLRSEDYRPNPDYWNSLLWQQLMGPRVHPVLAENRPSHLRLYAQSDGHRDRKTLLAINVSENESFRIDLPESLAGSGRLRVYRVTAPDPFARELRINGVEPGAEFLGSSWGTNPGAGAGKGASADEGLGAKLEALGGALTDDSITLGPLSYCFVLGESPGPD